MTKQEYIEMLNIKIEEARCFIEWAIETENEQLFKTWTARLHALENAYNNI